MSCSWSPVKRPPTWSRYASASLRSRATVWITSGTFFRSTVLPTCSTTNASSGMRQSARPRARAPGAALQPPRIEEVARHVALRVAQRAGQDQTGGVHVLRPPARIPPGPASVLGLARQRADLGGEPHLEPGIGALQPVVQPMGVAVHRGPALEREIRDEKDAGHGAFGLTSPPLSKTPPSAPPPRHH